MNNFLQKGLEFQKEMRKTTVAAITTALALVVALVWQDALKSGVESLISFLGLQQQLFLYKIISAIIISFVCAFGIMHFSKLQEKK